MYGMLVQFYCIITNLSPEQFLSNRSIKLAISEFGTELVAVQSIEALERQIVTCLTAVSARSSGLALFEEGGVLEVGSIWVS
jgi:hypothetical protein